ncbi:hypothetical protein [Flavobacterium gawalongense]|uniref:YD repeat-containing protein n=1 Tax=Flavobacterium gawalongense TaxID=2594432 RepID=A0ABY3CL75_9FLAO|nr:hypothetical protein [Flavobacterium gawalongense]TRX02032.1 hypothetical protein FNW33_07635 [Flavobacterium gawalongense]TRX06560.1 hypothetical protein FNW12_08170 [Flavobacterium gawalongense]
MKMKNRTYYRTMLLLGVLMLNSCSSNSETETKPVDSVLVKKIILTHSANDIETFTYKYDGNKIVSRKNDGGFVSNYTYTGNVITKIEELSDNKFQSSRDYTYVDGKVATLVLKTNYDGTDTHSYTYNSNGTVSYKRTRSNGVNTGILTIVNGNIVKNEVFYNGSLSSTYTYEYDTKNNPFKNVLGFNLLLDTNEEMFSPNNMTQDGGGTPALNYTFKYDANGFPMERKLSDANYGSSHRLSQYFY